ncbi:hypothetical protein STTU_4484 [Streptomyces sp. Tu6071]|nr:hypothetical protein STTU_4484 [Streptomyces sp. Tu6071]
MVAAGRPRPGDGPDGGARGLEPAGRRRVGPGSRLRVATVDRILTSVLDEAPGLDADTDTDLDIRLGDVPLTHRRPVRVLLVASRSRLPARAALTGPCR